MKNEILKIIMENHIDWDEIPDFTEDFNKNNFNYEFVDSDEDGESYSTNVNWYIIFKVSKNNKSFIVRISGTAIAEISYERWVDTYGYTYDSEDISIEEEK